jgi:hypothetical protein
MCRSGPRLISYCSSFVSIHFFVYCTFLPFFLFPLCLCRCFLCLAIPHRLELVPFVTGLHFLPSINISPIGRHYCSERTTHSVMTEKGGDLAVSCFESKWFLCRRYIVLRTQRFTITLRRNVNKKQQPYFRLDIVRKHAMKLAKLNHELLVWSQCYNGLLGSRRMGYFADACESGRHMSVPSVYTTN